MQSNKFIDRLFSFFNKNSLFLFISISMFVSFSIVVISMALYNSSGAAQLDLSRPGYKDVRGGIEVISSEFDDYQASGPINSSVINEFKLLYEKQSKKIKSFDAFGGDPLNPEELGIGVIAD